MAGEQEGSTAEQVKDRIPRDRPLGVIHSGGRYLYGFGPNSYGIWDAAKEGPPAEEFPATKQGRLDGWRRYLELEPVAQNIPPDQSPVKEELEEVEIRSRRGGIIVGGGIALLLIIGLVVFVLTRSNEGGPDGSGSGTVIGPKVTHLDVTDATGAVTLGEDLTQKSFSPPGQGFTRHMIATWSGAQTKLKFDFDDPSPGEYTTSLLPRVYQLEISYTPPGGTELVLRSRAGECTVKIDTADTNALSGSFTCAGVTPQGSDQTVDLKGTFFAQAA